MPVIRPLIGCTTYHKTAAGQTIKVYGLMPSYTEAISRAGGLPLMIPLGLSEAELNDIVDRVDGILLPGGGDIEPALYHGSDHATIYDINPDRDRVEMAIVRRALATQKPILAICRGHQIFNVALGGSLWEDVESLMPGAQKHNFLAGARTDRPHTVEIKPGSRLATCLGQSSVRVNSLHHQGVRQIASGLVATATAPDGLVEALEAPGHPFAVSVQWHPENLLDVDGSMLGLFAGLVAAAQATPVAA